MYSSATAQGAARTAGGRYRKGADSETDEYGEVKYRQALLGAFGAGDSGSDASTITHLTAPQLALMELVVSPAASRWQLSRGLMPPPTRANLSVALTRYVFM